VKNHLLLVVDFFSLLSLVALSFASFVSFVSFAGESLPEESFLSDEFASAEGALSLALDFPA